MKDPLEGSYPAFYESADAASLEGQRHYIRALRIRLAGLLVATVGGGIVVSVGAVAVGGWVALVGFLTAFLAEVWNAVEKPDRAWYEGRAAAESAKTLAWRYAVKGESFDGDQDRDREFIDRINELLHDLKDVSLPSPATPNGQITTKMRELRQGPFEDRRAAYREGRIETQREWYTRKAEYNRAASRRWTLALFIFEGFGIAGGVLLIVGVLTIDAIGVFAALAATVTAWTQAKQFKTLATAYSVTAQELAGAKDDLDAVQSENGWAKIVGQAEEAISREHTLWRASRGVRPTTPQSHAS